MSNIAQLEKELATTRRLLADKETVFDNILDSTLAGYWDWYIQDEYEYMSPTFKKMFGYEDHEIENHPDSWQRMIHPDDLSYVFEVYNKHVSSKGEYPYDNEVRYYHKDGSIVWVYCRGKVIEWDEEGNPVRMVGCHVDITKLKEAEQTEIYARELEKRNKELQQFAYVASHDLQEPLMTIKSFVELVENEFSHQLEEEVQMYLKYISTSAKRMSSLVRDLLEYSRLGKDRTKLEIDLAEIIRDVITDLKTNIEATQATIHYEKNLPTLEVYLTEMRLLFQNLISNAIKFRHPGVAPQIQITVEEQEKQWLFQISDNGIGIAPEHRERIFVIFQRLHNKSEYEGTGIGLAQCAKIVDLHDGKIWVDSTVGQGSTFSFTLPK